MMNVHNGTDKPLALLYISPSWSGNFRAMDEQLGDRYIMPGQSARVDFEGDGDCNFDLRAVFLDGTRLDHYGVDLCKVGDWYIAE